jgi:parvulin-like peptidyl-prolyl isomerase
MKVSLFLVFVMAGGLFSQVPAPPAAKAKASKPAAAAKKATPQTKAAPAAKAAVAKPAAAPAAKAAVAKPAAAPTEKAVLTVGTEKVTAKEFDAFIDSIPEQYREQARGPMKRQVAEQIVRIKLLAGEARRRGMDKDEAMLARLEFQKENMLANAAFNDILSETVVDEAATRKHYETNKNEYETVQASHILVKFKGSPVPVREGQKELTEEEALAKATELRKKLLDGADFAAIAKAESDDTGSGANGGSLGPGFQRGQMVPAFEQVAFGLPVGQVSEPVKTQFGYHLIKVEKHETKTFEDVRAELEKKLKPEKARESVEKMRQDSSVVLDESFFGPETPAAAPVATPAPAPQK